MGPDVHTSSFPFLTVDEWSGACASFVTACSGLVGEPSGWSTLSHHREADADYIRLARDVPKHAGGGSADGEQQTAYEISEDCGGAIEEESDNEDLLAPSRELQPCSERKHHVNLTVTYDILLSSSYRVPILHFNVRDSSGSPVTDLDTIFSEIVPIDFRNQVQNVGIIGGVSMMDHPITGLPSFFVHPCNTADALRQAAASRNVAVSEYLFLWMGIVPPAVGLFLPASGLGRLGITLSSPTDQKQP